MYKTTFATNLATNNPNIVTEISKWLEKGHYTFKDLSNIFICAGMTPKGLISYKKSPFSKYLFEDANNRKYLLTPQFDHSSGNLVLYVLEEPMDNFPINKYEIFINNGKVTAQLVNN